MEKETMVFPWDGEEPAEIINDYEDNVAEGEALKDPAKDPAEAPGSLETDPAAKEVRWRVSLSDFFARVDRGEYMPIKTGMGFIDDLIGGGFVPGTITMIVADPGAGKTSLCQQMAAEFARSGFCVSFVNYEMDEGQLYARDLSREMKPTRSGENNGLAYDPSISASSIMRGMVSTKKNRVALDTARRFQDTIEDYSAVVYPRLFYNMFVKDEDERGELIGKPRPIRNTAGDLRLLTKLLLKSYQKQKAEAAAKGWNMARIHAAILFVDYIQLISTGSESKINALEEVTGILSSYAKEGNTLVFAISSASKESRRNAEPKAPKAEDNEEEDNEEKDEPAEAQGRPIAIYCDKSRFGEPGRVSHVRFIGSASKFMAPNYQRPRYAGEFEKKGYLCKASANGASVLEYSAAYFISLNRDTHGDRHAKIYKPSKSLADIAAEIEAENEAT